MRALLKFPIIVFLLLIIHGAILGMTDDEAYYWVLAQKPALGYAFHPPAVAWFIWLAQALFDWLPDVLRNAVVRLPAADMSALIVFIGISWFERLGVNPKLVSRGAWILVSFAGFTALSWMIVPDVPLFFGWMLAFYGSWGICHGKTEQSDYLWLFLGIVVAILSKYSGVLVTASVLLCLGFGWLNDKSKRIRINKATSIVIVATVIALVPVCYWNAQHDWASILYQLKGRHNSGGISYSRWMRFWFIEAVFAGPAVLTFAIVSVLGVFRAKKTDIAENSVENKKIDISRFVLFWALPAGAVFCIQPLFSDFKPHWALIVWLPFVLALGAFVTLDDRNGIIRRLSRFHVKYGLSLAFIILLSCHVPVGTWVISKITGKVQDPRMDVTNDMYGWGGLRDFIRDKLGYEGLSLPVVGSRYQTASQAAFALDRLDNVTKLPREPKEREEWPDLGLTWPQLSTRLLFVADNRYSTGPEFEGGECTSLGKLETFRVSYLAKWIEVWDCRPVRLYAGRFSCKEKM